MRKERPLLARWMPSGYYPMAGLKEALTGGVMILQLAFRDACIQVWIQGACLLKGCSRQRLCPERARAIPTVVKTS